MTRFTANNLSPLVRRFARFANAMYQAGTVNQANRLLDYAAEQTDPGFGRFYALARTHLQEHGLREVNRPAFPGERLPRPQPGDDALLPVAVRVELTRLLAWVADDAYRREDVSAIARGEFATEFGVHKKGRTIYDQHGRALARVLLAGADESVYACIANHWAPPVGSEPTDGDDHVTQAQQAGIDAHADLDFL